MTVLLTIVFVAHFATALAALELEDELAAELAEAKALGQSAVWVTVLPPLVADEELELELEELELEDELELDELEPLELDEPLEAAELAEAPAPAEADTPPTLAEAALEELADELELEELELEAAATSAGLVKATVKATKMETNIYFIISPIIISLALRQVCFLHIIHFSD